MKKEIDPRLLEKYLHADCTDEEILLVHNWYDEFEADEDLLSYLPAIEKEQLRKALLERIKTNIDTNKAHDKEGKVRSLRFPRSSFFYLIALSAAVFIVAIGIVVYIQNKSLANRQPVWADKVVVNNLTQAYIKKILPDGSTVWLSPKSIMEYPKAFEKDKREITMMGEAFFEVTKNPARPFIIYSGALATRVWGTSFKVNADENSSFNQVAVLTGKVSVSIPPTYSESLKNLLGMPDNSNQVMLLPNQQATYLKVAKKLQKTRVTDRYILSGWGKQSISFNNEPIKKVIEILNKRFDVHIITADKNVEKYRLRADFTNQNLADILEIIHLSMNVGYTINNNQIELKRI